MMRTLVTWFFAAAESRYWWEDRVAGLIYPRRDRATRASGVGTLGIAVLLSMVSLLTCGTSLSSAQTVPENEQKIQTGSEKEDAQLEAWARDYLQRLRTGDQKIAELFATSQSDLDEAEQFLKRWHPRDAWLDYTFSDWDLFFIAAGLFSERAGGFKVQWKPTEGRPVTSRNGRGYFYLQYVPQNKEIRQRVTWPRRQYLLLRRNAPSAELPGWRIVLWAKRKEVADDWLRDASAEPKRTQATAERAKEMRTVHVLITGGPEKKPLAGLNVVAMKRKGRHPQNEVGRATTDQRGRAELQLSPGWYRWSLQSDQEIPYLCRFGPPSWIVEATPAVQQFTANLHEACEVILQAVDIDTGQGVPGVKFGREAEDAELWLQVVVPDTIGSKRPIKYFQAEERQPDESEYESDVDGYYRCFVNPFTGWKYMFYEIPPGYERVLPVSEEVDLRTSPGGRVQHTFWLRKATPEVEKEAAGNHLAARRAIASVGGKAQVDEDRPGKPIVAVYLIGGDINDAVLARLQPTLQGLAELRRLAIASPNVTDQGLRHLTGLDQLRDLTLNSRITGSGIKHLAKLAQLQKLNFACSGELTDEGLAGLQRLTRLRTLYLCAPQVTDEGLQHLSGLTDLGELRLSYTDATERGLEHLKGLKSLRTLRLIPKQNTQFSGEAVRALQRALPDCEIIR